MSNTAPSRADADPWWSFLLADGAHHKKPHSPTHPKLGLGDLVTVILVHQIQPAVTSI